MIMQSKECWCRSFWSLQSSHPLEAGLSSVQGIALFPRVEARGLVGKPHVLYLCVAVFPRKFGTSKITAMPVFLLKIPP